MDSKIAYTSLLILRFFIKKNIDKINIFEIEEELEQWKIGYGEVMQGLMLLFALDLIENDGIDICMLKAITDAHLLALGKMIINT